MLCTFPCSRVVNLWVARFSWIFRTEQVDFSVTVAGHAQHGVAEKAERVVLLQLVSLYVFSVITVQAFSYFIDKTPFSSM